MGDVYGDGDGSGKWAKAMVRVRCSVKYTGRIGLWLELGSGYDVRMILNFRVMVKQG